MVIFLMIGDRLFGAVVTADGYLFAADRELYPTVSDLPIAYPTL